MNDTFGAHLPQGNKETARMPLNPGRFLRGLLTRLSPGRRGALAILGGTASGQALALVVAPVLSRVYSPADFGVFTVLSSLVAIVGTVATLRFDLAVPLPESEKDAHSLATLGLLSTIATFILTSTVVGLGGNFFARAFSQPYLMPAMWLVPIASAAMGAYLVLNQLAIRHRRYGAIGRRNLLQSVAMVLTQVGAGILGNKTGGLTLGLAVGQSTSAVSLLRGARLLTEDARMGRDRHALARVARRYRRFPLLLTASGLLNVMGLQLPVVLISYWYGSTVAGWMGLTQRVLSLPVMLIGTAIAQVYVAELSRAARADPARARRLFAMATKRLLVVASAAAAVLLVAGPLMFRLVFGQQWTMSGEFARALSLSLAAQLVAVPLSQTLTVFERQTMQLAWDTSRLLLLVGAVTVSHIVGASATVALWAFGISSACAYAISWFLSHHTIKTATLRPTSPSS